jgi:hypothetical protein
LRLEKSGWKVHYSPLPSTQSLGLVGGEGVEVLVESAKSHFLPKKQVGRLEPSYVESMLARKDMFK